MTTTDTRPPGPPDHPGTCEHGVPRGQHGGGTIARCTPCDEAEALIKAEAEKIMGQGREQIAEMIGDVVKTLVISGKTPRIFIGELAEGVERSVFNALKTDLHLGQGHCPQVTFSAHVDMACESRSGIIEITAEIGVTPVSRARFKFQ